MTPPIAILGAGPSGLTLAKLLDGAGIGYIIFERDASEEWAIGRGGTLDLHPEAGQLALQEAGLFEQFRELGRYDATTRLADYHGNIAVELGADGKSDRPEIDRKDLRSLLLKSIPSSNIRWGRKVKEVSPEGGEGVAIHFSDGSTERGFQLVVGADGLWSKARSAVTDAQPQYSGITYLITLITPGNDHYGTAVSLAGQGNYASFGEEKQVIAQKLGDGSYSITLGLKLPENWTTENAGLLKNPHDLRAWLLRDCFAGWAQSHRDLIEHSEGAFHPWPLYHMPSTSLSWQTVPGVVLLGDAAHASTPFLGEGVNSALLDSVQLAQQITKHGLERLTKAVAEYEEQMFPRGINLIEKSSESGRYMFSSGAPQSWLAWFASTQ